jgi:hypothetical protein
MTSDAAGSGGPVLAPLECPTCGVTYYARAADVARVLRPDHADPGPGAFACGASGCDATTDPGEVRAYYDGTGPDRLADTGTDADTGAGAENGDKNGDDTDTDTE